MIFSNITSAKNRSPGLKRGTQSWSPHTSEEHRTFQSEPKRCVVERTFAWLNRFRRLAEDFEETIASAEAWVTLASIRVLSRRLARV
jgi:transposase